MFVCVCVCVLACTGGQVQWIELRNVTEGARRISGVLSRNELHMHI